MVLSYGCCRVALFVTALAKRGSYLGATNRPVVGDSITFMIRDDLGGIASRSSMRSG
jgi:hypothetical protein